MSFRSLTSGGYPLSGDPFLSASRLLQRSLEDAFRTLPTATTEAASMPVAIDVKEDEKGFAVTADLPGLTENDVEVSFDDGVLTLRGEKKIEREEQKDTWHIVERSSGSFARRLAVSAPIDADKIEATFDKGVLRVMLPKLSETKSTAKKIEIKPSKT